MPRYRRFGVVILLGVLAAVLGVAQTNVARPVLRQLGLIGSPSPYTELAFSTPDSLPAVVRAPNAPLALAFVIGNHTGQARTYSWSVTTTGRGTATTELARGAAPVEAGHLDTVHRVVNVACDSSSVQVRVTLMATGESIELWLQCSPAGGSKP